MDAVRGEARLDRWTLGPGGGGGGDGGREGRGGDRTAQAQQVMVTRGEGKGGSRGQTGGSRWEPEPRCA